jgi:hypothetical protein
MVVEQVFGIEFAQPVQGERRPGAIAQNRSRPARSAASMRTQPSTEKPPPCSHCPIECASTTGNTTTVQLQIGTTLVRLSSPRATAIQIAGRLFLITQLGP